MSRIIHHRGFVTALKAECFVLFRSRLPWLLLLAPGVASVIKMCLIKINSISNQTFSAVKGSNVTTVTGYGFLVDGLLTSLMVTYLLFLGYAAYTFAIDRERGIVRQSVIRSVSRRELIMAKYTCLSLFAFLSVSVTLLSAWLCANFLWVLGPVIEEGYQLIGVNEIKKEIILGLELALLPLPACLAFGLLFSVCARSATEAVSMAIGAGLVLDVFKSALGDIQYFIFSSFQPSLIDRSYLNDVQRIVSGYSDVLIDKGVHQLNLWVPISEALLFLVITLVVIQRRNL